MCSKSFRMRMVIFLAFLFYINDTNCQRWEQREAYANERGSQAAIAGEPGSFDTVKGHPALSEEFFTGQLQPATRCYTAKMFLKVMCGLSTELERMKLATLITNCHLEAMGRPAIIWHDEHRLKHASEEDVSIVMQFLPYLRGICDKSANSWSLALLQSKMTREESDFHYITELRAAMAKFREDKDHILNRAKEERILFQNVSNSFSKYSEQLFNLSARMSKQQDALLKKLRDDVNSTVKDIWKDSVSSYNKLAESVRAMQENIAKVREERAKAAEPPPQESQNSLSFVELLFREHIVARLFRLTHFFTLFTKGFGLRLTMQRTFASFMFCAQKMSSLMKFLERYEYIGGRFMVLISGLRTFLGIFSFLIVYKLVEAILRFLSMLYSLFKSLKDFVVEWLPRYKRTDVNHARSLSSGDMNEEIRIALESGNIQIANSCIGDGSNVLSRSNSHSSLFSKDGNSSQASLQINAHDPLMASQVANLSDSVSEVSDTVAMIWDVLQDISHENQEIKSSLYRSKSAAERRRPEEPELDRCSSQKISRSEQSEYSKKGARKQSRGEKKQTPKRSTSRYNLRARGRKTPSSKKV